MQTAISSPGLRNLFGTIAPLVALILGTSCTPSGAVITIETSAGSLQVDHTVRASVEVENIADLAAYEMHLSFDTSTLEVIELNDGGFIQADFIVQNTFDNTAGTIDYAVAQIEHPPVTGSGTLLEIVFRAKADCDSVIHFRETQAAPAGVLLSDSTGMAIQVSLIHGEVNVRDSTHILPAVNLALRCALFC
jgi:hypothetical protein